MNRPNPDLSARVEELEQQVLRLQQELGQVRMLTRTPIPIRVYRFNEPIDCPGLGVNSAATANHKLKFEYWPWLQHHRVEFMPEPGKPSHVSFIEQSRVVFWQSIDAVLPTGK